MTDKQIDRIHIYQYHNTFHCLHLQKNRKNLISNSNHTHITAPFKFPAKIAAIYNTQNTNAKTKFYH